VKLLIVGITSILSECGLLGFKMLKGEERAKPLKIRVFQKKSSPSFYYRQN